MLVQRKQAFGLMPEDEFNGYKATMGYKSYLETHFDLALRKFTYSRSIHSDHLRKLLQMTKSCRQNCSESFWSPILTNMLKGT